MGFVIINRRQRRIDVAAVFARFVEIDKQMTQFARIGLTQESVNLFNQTANGGFFVHGLVRQRTEIGAQRRNHPTRQIDIRLIGGFAVTLDGHHHLLRGETVPAAQRLRVIAAVSIVIGHVLTHDVGRVARHIETRFKAVLQLHTGGIFGVNGGPAGTAIFNGGCFLGDEIKVFAHGDPHLGVGMHSAYTGATHMSRNKISD